MAPLDFLVSTDWLASNYKDSGVRVLDGTWIMPGAEDNLVKGAIPGATFFDLDEIAAPHATLKHMLPGKLRFETAMNSMGISVDDHIICYDRHGMFSAPRLWWTFRMFGHARVSVLNGGLPSWTAGGHPVSEYKNTHHDSSAYTASAPLIGVITMKEILSELQSNPQIVDARPAGRFMGTSPEPRPGLRSGRIPGSLNLPFGGLVENGKLLPLGKLADQAGAAGVDLTRPIITTCGSGITAAGLAFVFYRLGAKNIRVYDGSWSEWGASNAPIEV